MQQNSVRDCQNSSGSCSDRDSTYGMFQNSETNPMETNNGPFQEEVVQAKLQPAAQRNGFDMDEEINKNHESFSGSKVSSECDMETMPLKTNTHITKLAHKEGKSREFGSPITGFRVNLAATPRVPVDASCKNPKPSHVPPGLPSISDSRSATPTLIKPGYDWIKKNQDPHKHQVFFVS